MRNYHELSISPKSYQIRKLIHHLEHVRGRDRSRASQALDQGPARVRHLVWPSLPAQLQHRLDRLVEAGGGARVAARLQATKSGDG